MSVDHRARSVGIIRISFFIYLNMKVCCVFSLESPQRGDSNEYTQHTIINIKRKSPEIIPNTIMSGAMGFVMLGTQERGRNNRSERAMSDRATEVLL